MHHIERAYIKQIEEKLGTEKAVIKAKTTTLRQQCLQAVAFVCMHHETSANNSQQLPTLLGPTLL